MAELLVLKPGCARDGGRNLAVYVALKAIVLGLAPEGIHGAHRVEQLVLRSLSYLLVLIKLLRVQMNQYLVSLFLSLSRDVSSSRYQIGVLVFS